MQQIEINKREFTLEEEIRSKGKYCFFKKNYRHTLFAIWVISFKSNILDCWNFN